MIKMKLVEIPRIKEPGDFYYMTTDTKDELHMRCVGGKFDECRIMITTGPAAHPRFHWDGNLECPTLTPSIGCEKRCGWHGHITNGEILP